MANTNTRNTTIEHMYTPEMTHTVWSEIMSNERQEAAIAWHLQAHDLATHVTYNVIRI